MSEQEQSCTLIEIMEAVDDAVMRVGASANCYNEPADANSGAEYVAARVRGTIVAMQTRQAQRSAAPLSAPVSTGEQSESGWLLEKMHNGNVHYISADNFLQWTSDPNKALRLARREDAEALCTIVEDCEKIASHEWVPAAPATAPDGERVWHGPADEMPSGVELLAVYRNTFSIGNKHEPQMIAHKVEAWCVSRELVASALRAVTAATEQVQCADCLEWIDRDANHTCRQQVRRNQRKAAK